MLIHTCPVCNVYEFGGDTIFLTRKQLLLTKKKKKKSLSKWHDILYGGQHFLDRKMSTKIGMIS